MVKYNFYEKIKKIDEVLSKDFITEEVFNLIKEKSVENYLFKKVESAKWFFPLKEKGYFSPKSAPKPEEVKQRGYYKIPEWNVLPYIERISKQVNIPINEKYVDELLEIIRNVTNYHIQHDKKLDNYRTWWYFVKILCNLPNSKIPMDVIDLISVWLDSKFDVTLPGSEIATKLLPKFLDSNDPEDWKKAEKIVEIITGIKWKSVSKTKSKLFGEKEESETIIDAYWLLKSFKTNAAKVGEKCSKNIIFVLANRLQQIFKREDKKQNFKDYSYIWFRSMFSEPRFPSHNAKETLTLILRDVLIAKAIKDIETTKKILKKFLNNNEYQYPLFKRLVIFVIGNQWNGYKNLFWEIIDRGEGSEIFDDPYYKPELYEILKRNIRKFTQEEKKKIKEIIDEGPQQYLPEKDQEKYIAYWKQKWYSAMKTDEYFKPLYEKQKQITLVDEKITFIKSPEVKWIQEFSPLTKEKILAMKNEQLAEYLRAFRTKDSFKGFTVNGLADMLKMAVKEKPEKFTKNLTPFLDLGYLYIYELLWGMREVWSGRKEINWDELFQFIKRYIKKDGFWEDKFKVKEDDWPATHLWVTGMIGELVQEGTKDDSWAFSEEYFKDAKEIILLIFKQQKTLQKEEEIGDAITHALNSSFGKVITALIYLALRIARTEEKKDRRKEVKWGSDIKNAYEDILQREIIEAYTLLGQYLASFYYLDKRWVEDKIKEISPYKNKRLWEVFMEGYLFGNRIYKNLYNLMRGHYINAIDYNFREKSTEGNLIHHICIAYLQGNECIEDKNSLFKKILDKWCSSHIKEAIGFFWMQRDYLSVPIKENKKMVDRVISFWRWIYENKYKDKQRQKLNEDEDDKKILSDLLKLTIFLKNIDSETFNWLVLSAPYAHDNFNSPIFIEYLNRFEDKQSITYTGKIFLKMLSNPTFTPDYDKEHIRSIVEKIYQKGDRDDADRICNTYGERGYEFLRDIYEKYEKKK